jgi:hypothetical protein
MGGYDWAARRAWGLFDSNISARMKAIVGSRVAELGRSMLRPYMCSET